MGLPGPSSHAHPKPCQLQGYGSGVSHAPAPRSGSGVLPAYLSAAGVQALRRVGRGLLAGPPPESPAAGFSLSPRGGPSGLLRSRCVDVVLCSCHCVPRLDPQPEKHVAGLKAR